jgi:hypothetical protein
MWLRRRLQHMLPRDVPNAYTDIFSNVYSSVSPGMLMRTTAAVPAKGSIWVENTMPAAVLAAEAAAAEGAEVNVSINTSHHLSSRGASLED